MAAVATQSPFKAPSPKQQAPSGTIKVCQRQIYFRWIARLGIMADFQTYYQNKIEAAELEITKKTQNLRRLEAQRNALNTRGSSISLRR